MIFTPSPSPSSQKSADTAQQKTQSDKEVSKPSIAPVAKENSPQDPRYQHSTTVKKAENERSIRVVGMPPRSAGDTIALICTVLLTIIGVVGIIVAICTLGVIERQTKASLISIKVAQRSARAASIAAEAALLNAQAVLNSERPWLTATIEPSAPGYFRIRVKNVGRTPARFVSGGFSHSFHGTPQGLPAQPQYGLILMPDNWFVSPEDFFYVYRSIDESKSGFSPTKIRDSRPVNQGPPTDILFVYGKLVYEDILPENNRTPHETRWCFSYLEGEGFIRTGPDRERSKDYNDNK